jgi:sugar lactone lactonase YvrE
MAATAWGQSNYATPYTFTTFAGNAPAGADGPGLAARFKGPCGMALDSAGNLYVADTGDDTIRKVTPAGAVSTLAGSVGRSGTADGTGPAALFSNPQGVAVDSAGNVYVADTGNDLIRKITPAGVVTTLAGGQWGGSADGTGSAAAFNYPTGIVVDGAGNLYVSDCYNETIRKITPDGTVTTFAGTATYGGDTDGTGAYARFLQPYGLALDSAGNLYVADSANNRIRKITPEAVVTTLPGEGFNTPTWVAVDSAGTFYVSDSGNEAIRAITSAGVVTTLAGTLGQSGSADGTGAAAMFNGPAGILVLSHGGLLVADSGNDTIRAITSADVVTTIAGTGPIQSGSADGTGGAAKFNGPTAVAADSEGNLYVADTGNDTIRKVTPAEVVTTLAGLAGHSGSADGKGSAARFNQPSGVAVDDAGNVYVADTGNYTIREITPQGAVSTLAGTPGVNGTVDGTGAGAQFGSPTGVAVDSSGNVYVADLRNDTIRKIAPGGLVTTFAGATGQSGSANGSGGTARFTDPNGVAVDSAGNVYVADTGNQLIRKISPSGAVSTLAGGGASFASDGTGSAANFTAPDSVAVDNADNVYVADNYEEEIRKITPAGAVTTLGGWSFLGESHGVPPNYGNEEGTGPGAEFADPSGVAVDSSGNVYVADTGNNSIRKGNPAIATQPVSQTVNSGDTVVFSVGTAPSETFAYQWQLNGVNLFDGDGVTGSNGPQLIVQGASAANNGDYTCIITYGYFKLYFATSEEFSFDSNAASLVVANTSTPGYLINLSGRGYVGTGDGVLIGGFYIVGSTSRTVLIQALGPALAGQGVAGVLEHPALTIHDATGATIYSNTGWGSSQVLLEAAAAAYANPVLQPNSGDSEVLLTLPPGGYTAEISGADGGTGVALCAIYELP